MSSTRALAEIRARNERNPQKPLGVKLRWGGFEAPDWAAPAVVAALARALGFSG